jgi:protein-S-isoprenylcysteine O-methyltransferase Ste14
VKRALDWPQAWFVLALALTGASTALLNLQGWPMGGVVLLGLGLGVFAAAVVQMRRAMTTLNPRGQPSRLVTSGVFEISRNPIYLGNVIMILSLATWIGAPIGVLVAAGFAKLVTMRFILAEEDRLRATFGQAFDDWAGRVRRWI